MYQKQTSPHEIKNPGNSAQGIQGCPIDNETVFIRISAQPRISAHLE